MDGQQLVTCALLVCSITSAGCGHAPEYEQRRIVADQDAIVPGVDYHVHLLGPYALPMPDPPGAEVAVPPELGRLLEARARLAGAVGSPADLDEAFARDARLLQAHVNPTKWLSDKYWFMRYINLAQRDGRRYVPSFYAIDDAVGYVTGTVAVGDVHFENFLLAIRRNSDGRWRIAAESTTWRTRPRYTEPITADRLIADLDEAGIGRAVVLSEAFWIGVDDSTARMIPVADPADAVRRENDWTAEQVARYPDRLVMACAVNPLLAFALAELARCSSIPGVIGIKLNFGDSGVDFHDTTHIAVVRQFFAAANHHGMAIIVHLEPGRFYGPVEVELFLSQVASAAPGVTIQIAHLAGNGPGITSPEALKAFAEARSNGDPGTDNLYFDFAGLVTADMSRDEARLMATRMRQIGLDRILFGSDASPGTDANPSAARHWEATIRALPLSDDEMRIIAGNIAPYLTTSRASSR